MSCYLIKLGCCGLYFFIHLWLCVVELVTSTGLTAATLNHTPLNGDQLLRGCGFVAMYLEETISYLKSVWVCGSLFGNSLLWEVGSAHWELVWGCLTHSCASMVALSVTITAALQVSFVCDLI